MPILDRTTKQAEDLRNPSWRSETGYPSRVMSLSGNTMQFCPPMAALTPTIGGVEAPASLTLASPTGTPDPRIPDPHHVHLCTGALYLLLLKDAPKGDLSKANKALQDFMQLIGVVHGSGQHVPASK